MRYTGEAEWKALDSEFRFHPAEDSNRETPVCLYVAAPGADVPDAALYIGGEVHEADDCTRIDLLTRLNATTRAGIR